MPNPGYKPEVLLKALEVVRHHGSITGAAKALKLNYNTLNGQYQEARRRYGDLPQPANENPLQTIVDGLRGELEAARQALKGAVRPKFTIRQDHIKRSEKIKALVIGDAHDSPLLPKDRFAWIGAHAEQSKPDIIIQIGDFATLDSLNSHVPNESYGGKAKPTFMADMESFNLALEAFGSRLNHKPEMHCTLGNHERRLYLFEDRAPEAYGMMQHELQSIFDRHGWTFSPYGSITYYGGVGFVHAPINRMGKSIGGKNAENTTANELIHDLVFGHSHIERMTRYSKLGPSNYVIALNVGCALPDGHVEDYAEHSMSGGWSWGITEVTLQHGHIQDRHWISMTRLEELYG